MKSSKKIEAKEKDASLQAVNRLAKQLTIEDKVFHAKKNDTSPVIWKINSDSQDTTEAIELKAVTGIKTLNDYTPGELSEARNKIAQKHEDAAYKIRQEDSYADHVTEETKDACLAKELTIASEIRQGVHDNHFWCWQRIYYELSGECVALLS